MGEDEERVRRFGLRLKAEATVTVEGADARVAWDALDGLLDGATARIVAGAGVGLELADIRVLPDVALALLDGRNPIEPVRAALSRWIERKGEGDG